MARICKVLLLLFLTVLSGIGESNSSNLTLSPSPGHGPIVADSGTAVVINCAHSTVTTANGFLWRNGSIELENGQPRVSIELNDSGTRSTLTVHNVSKADEGFYTCSHAGVSVGIKLQVIVNAHYKNITLVQNFTVGENATILCHAFLGDPPGYMTWSRGGVFLSSEEDVRYNATNDLLAITNIQTTDSGVYQCQIYRDIQGLVKPERNITVNVFNHSMLTPRIEKNQPQHLDKWYEDPLNLTCNIVSGAEPITVKWYIRTDNTLSMITDNNRTLYRDPKHYSSGEYQCHATNSHGSDSLRVMVVVQAPPRPSTIELAPIRAVEGSEAILLSQMLELPIDTNSLKYEWKKQNHDTGEFVPVVLEERVVMNPLNGQLNIYNVTQSDAGLYQMNISNVYGASVQTMSLLVEGAVTALPPDRTTPPPPVRNWFTFEISSESSTECYGLELQMLLAALESLMCTTDDDVANCDVTIHEIECSTKMSGQFSASVSQDQSIQNTFSLTVNGIQLTVTTCGIETCQHTPKPTSVAGDSNAATIGGSVIVVIAVAVGTAVLAGLAVCIYKTRYSRHKPNSHDVEAPQPQPVATNPSPTNSNAAPLTRPHPPNQLFIRGPPRSSCTMTPGRSSRMTPELDQYEECSPSMEVVEGLRRKPSPKPRMFQRSLSCGATSHSSNYHQWKSRNK